MSTRSLRTFEQAVPDAYWQTAPNIRPHVGIANCMHALLKASDAICKQQQIYCSSVKAHDAQASSTGHAAALSQQMLDSRQACLLVQMSSSLGRHQQQDTHMFPIWIINHLVLFTLGLNMGKGVLPPDTSWMSEHVTYAWLTRNQFRW